MHTHMRACAHARARTHAHTPARTHTRMHARTPAHAHARTRACAHAGTWDWMWDWTWDWTTRDWTWDWSKIIIVKVEYSSHERSGLGGTMARQLKVERSKSCGQLFLLSKGCSPLVNFLPKQDFLRFRTPTRRLVMFSRCPSLSGSSR